MDGHFKKMLQKRVYDLLSHKYGILMLLGGGFLLTISAFHFGEAWLEWSQEKYEAVFNSFSDNIAGKSFKDRLSVPLPIDVVYTWVNGTDPELIRQLELVKVTMDNNNNISREVHCSYTNCLCMGVLLYPPLPDSVVLSDILDADELFKNVTGLKPVQESKEGPANFTLLSLDLEEDARRILNAKAYGWRFHGVNHTIKPAFYTSDVSLPHGLLVPETVMMSGYPSQYNQEDIQQVISKRINMTEKSSVEVTMYSDKGVALLHLTQSSHYDQLIKDKNFTIEGKELRLSQVKLVWDLKLAVKDDVVAANRFEDNEELRYSLRSVEQFAPWVRHIYIVTNGQIPYWLNLDNPRLTIITHDEIFPNSSHLPTFSSPAIEANIHRIPGLSDKFLYLNDDVMFGSPVWPDDFFTHSTGHKLYLTWPVPNCNEGCPSTWIRDGYCDRACNSSECDWDGGDCLRAKGQVQLGAGFHVDPNQLSDYSSYCSTGCANNWLSDKYCDQACNNLDCGFDTGDCGVTDYDKLYDLHLEIGRTYYTLPPGELTGFFNLTQLLGENGKVTEAKYASDSAIRVAAMANKFKVMTVLLYKGRNATTLKFELVYTKGENDTAKLNLTLQVDPSVNKTVPVSNQIKENATEVTVNPDDQLDAQAFQGVAGPNRGPIASYMELEKMQRPDRTAIPELSLEILDVYTAANMSDALRKELGKLEVAKKEGELTEFGLKIRFQELLRKFADELTSLKTTLDQLLEKLAIEKKLNEERKSLSNQSDSDSLHKMEGFRENVADSEVEEKPDHRISHQEDADLQHLQDIAQLHQKSIQHLQKRSLSHPPQHQPYGLYQKGKLEGNQTIPGNNLRLQEHEADKIPGQNLVRSNISAVPQQAGNRVSFGSMLQRSGKGQKLKGKGWAQDHAYSRDLVVERVAGAVPGNQMSNGSQAQDNFNTGNVQGRKLLAVLFWSEHLARLEEEREQARWRMREDDLGEEMSDEEFLRLVNMEGAEEGVGGFPWERKESQDNLQNDREKERKANEYIVEGWQGRQLLDTFGDSLRHVNRIYNKEFGFASRKVPGHMPHMIDKNIMQDLQDRFPKEWDMTSSHKIRSSTDMQYAFAYYYYLMGVTVEVTVEEVFDNMDTDHSGVLSDREIRTLAAKMYDLPLYLEVLTGLEKMLINCSQGLDDPSIEALTEEQQEQYYDKDMPQVTKFLFTHCEELVTLVKEKFKPVHKYKTTIVDDADISFKMIHTNVSHVVGQLDDIRKHSKKFICLNDNIDHTREEAKTVKAILQDFYESILPNPSQFELARDYRNRFLHMDELRDWRVYRDRLRFWTHVALAILVILTILSFLGEKIESLRRKWVNQSRRRRQTSSSSESTPPSSVSVSPSPQSAEESTSLWGGQGLIETV